MNFKAVVWFLLFALVFSGCATGPNSVTLQGDGMDLEPFLTSIDHPALKVSSGRLTEINSALDFGSLPAIDTWSPEFKYMSLPNRLAFYIHNTGSEAVELAAIRLDRVQTEEPTSPFDTCEMEFPGVKIAPGEIFMDTICYFPTRKVTSQVTFTYLNKNGEPILSIPIKGSGRALNDYEAPPIGALGDFEIKKYKPEKEMAIQNNQLMENGKPVGLPKEGYWSRYKKAPPGCILAITGGGHIPNPRITVVGGTARNTTNIGINQGKVTDEINTGQFVTLVVEIASTDGSICVLDSTFWRIEGRFMWDYEEDFSGSITSIQFDAQKTRQNPIQLYWKNTGTHTVLVDVTYTENGVSHSLTLQRDFIVETDMIDIDRQMEDFYSWNHKGKVLVDHRAWHWNSRHRACRSSETFFTFHKGFLSTANHWRLLFNFPAITSWDPGVRPPPADPPSNHNGRNARFNTILNAKPRYYDINGNGRAVRTRCPQNRGVTRLKQFATPKHLGDEMEFRWHGNVHVRVGGEMGTIPVSPKDPVFYKWHKTIDGVYDAYKN
jgi:Common central domain of tyrosinase